MSSPGDGSFPAAGSEDRDVHFVARPRYKFAYDNHPSEIVERYFATSEEAVGALRRGDIDVVDFLFPDDAARLSSDATLRVVPYALPTIHVLVPNHRTLFTANQTFRRALAYGINRQAILETEILGNQKVAGCQLISGPFPPGTRDNDPLAYAYDQRIVPRPYNPRLAAILNALAHRELTEKAEKRGEAVPPETKIVLGFPASQLARVTCQAISQYLSVVGIACELRELPPEADGGCDRRAGSRVPAGGDVGAGGGCTASAGSAGRRGSGKRICGDGPAAFGLREELAGSPGAAARTASDR